jgi:uncharacterized protein YqiB (DUF1249 family)
MSYWVQIELDASGSDTFAIQLDLERVARVTVVRDSKKLASVKAVYSYNGQREELLLEKTAAKSFMEKWTEYQKMERTDQEAEPGIIFTAGTNKRLK